MGVPFLPDNLADILRNLADRVRVLETSRAQPWVAPTLINGWVNFGGGYNSAGYTWDGSRVYLRGLVKSGAGNTTVFTLPAGLRPPARCMFVALGATTSEGAYRVDVDTSGNVIVVTAGSYQYVSLDGVQFSVVA